MSTTRRETPLVDPYAEADHEWTQDEERRLLTEFARSRRMAVIAVRMQMDKRQIAVRLARLIFDASGELDDTRTANRHRMRWTATEDSRATRAFLEGRSLEQIATLLERTRLAVAWRLLEADAIQVTPSRPTSHRLGL